MRNEREYYLQLADRAMDERHLDRSRLIEELRRRIDRDQAYLESRKRRRLHTDHDEQLEDDILVAALAAFLLEHPFER